MYKMDILHSECLDQFVSQSNYFNFSIAPLPSRKKFSIEALIVAFEERISEHFLVQSKALFLTISTP